MPSDCSFDLVSVVDMQEVDNAVNQSLKEIQNRFDFKGSKSQITFQRDEKKIIIIADDEMKLNNIKDILSTKLAKRSVSTKVLSYEAEEKAFDGTIRQVANIIQGIEQEKAKQIVKIIKDLKLKVQSSIQDEKVRVSGKKKDDLQVVIQCIKNSKIDIPLQFVNFRP